MKKLQLVSMITLFVALAAQAQAGTNSKIVIDYKCQQDPKIAGVSTELVVTANQNLDREDRYAAVLTKIATTFPMQESTEKFSNVSRELNASDTALTYSGNGFELTVSEESKTDAVLGMYFDAKMTITNSQGQSEEQNLFCVLGNLIKIPAVTGSN